MYWYQINNDVNQLFVYAFFQMENMLNYYASHSNCYEKIKLNKDYYTHTFSENFIISCSSTFLNKDDSAKSITKVNIWSKLIYWAYDTNNIEFLKKQGNNFSNLINVRNNFIHKSAEKNKPENFAIDYVRQSDYTYFGYYINLLKEIVKTLENISGKVEKKGFIETNIILPGPNILGKIDPASLKRR
jgi:hypothetical protein